ncbi:hypothetical protein B484DRAFT_445246 [Ochromonadaceae sp. CCMP2298]|nr:hypothetical protein B484DRAFT_445246 [Ochromonadaceae sp. CCMP2298]
MPSACAPDAKASRKDFVENLPGFKPQAAAACLTCSATILDLSFLIPCLIGCTLEKKSAPTSAGLASRSHSSMSSMNWLSSSVSLRNRRNSPGLAPSAYSCSRNSFHTPIPRPYSPSTASVTDFFRYSLTLSRCNPVSTPAAGTSSACSVCVGSTSPMGDPEWVSKEIGRGQGRGEGVK